MGDSLPDNLADLEPEEVFLDALAALPSPANRRRLSAAGSASKLKEKNLIPPLNTPTSRRVSLPRASKCVLISAPAATNSKMPSEKPQTAAQKDPSAAILDRMETMFRGLREDIGKSEANTGKKIDELSDRLSARLTRAEKDLSKLGTDMATTRQELDSLREKIDVQERSIPSLIEAAISSRPRQADPESRTGRRPRGLGNHRMTNVEKEEKYWDARASLRMWPITGPDTAAAVVNFISEKLQCPEGMVNITDIVAITKVVPRPGAEARDQVVARFSSVRLRDEIKALTRNLDGTDRLTGVQIEPPDFLRTQYQTFQRLAFQLKKKHPSLKRSVRFDDAGFCLTMNILTSRGAEWKTIDYEDAQSTMKKARDRTDSISRRELEQMADLDGSRKKRRRTVDDSEDSDMDDDDNDVTIVENDTRDRNNTRTKPYCSTLTFINANARSLKPKIDSLHDCFVEKDLDLAFVTETWLQDGRELQETTDLLRENFALGLVARNRESAAANGRLYGGVAIVSRLKTTSLREFPLVNPESYEVLAAVAKVSGHKSKIFCLACYAPPNISPARANAMMEFVSDIVSEAKRSFPECSVIIAGDFNQWDPACITEEHPDIREINHGPTREGLAIDRSFVNFSRAIREASTLEPLESEDARPSDHRMAYAKAEFTKPVPKIIKYTYRQYTEAGATTFLADLESTSWEGVMSELSSDKKLERLQCVLGRLMAKHFKLKTTVRKSTDPPWFNDRILWLIKKRRKIYDREGRSPRYKILRRKSDKLARDRASVYLMQQRQAMTGPNASKNFFRNVKAFNSREKPPEFNVRDLFPGQSDSSVAEALASHFNAISAEFDGLREADIPTALDLDLPVLSPEQVAKRLRDIKKPKSTVAGDIFPALINRASHMLAIPLTDIFNSITVNADWPADWKVEYVTPIPKKAHPETPDDLRNISCTQMLSKTYESFVLEWLNSQVSLRTNQYGGTKGSGTEHYLVELWQKVLENLEDPRAGVLLTSIDYSKAFNRLNFDSCLQALKDKGACQQLIKIVASFLTDRTMRVKIGSALSDPKPIMGGVPQGSRLGVLLFNALIDGFEAHSTDIQPYDLPPPNPPTPTQRSDGHPAPLPVPAEPDGRDYRHLPPWRVEPLQVLKFVDDNVVQEKINFDSVPTDGYSFRTRQAIRTQNLTHGIVHEAKARGLKVNNAKTTALCISEVKNYIPKAFITDLDGNQIQSGNEMKILGFHFNSDVGMAAQVQAIRRKFFAKKWVLTHLGNNGFSKHDLLQVYKASILPIHDYCSCVYNSSLTKTQASALERLQAHALKTIYGYQHSYRSLLEITGLQTLQARRNARSDRFAAKCLENPRYRDWFPLQAIARPTRGSLKYKEMFARTKRLYNSPLYFMRRRLNGKQE